MLDAVNLAKSYLKNVTYLHGTLHITPIDAVQVIYPILKNEYNSKR